MQWQAASVAKACGDVRKCNHCDALPFAPVPVTIEGVFPLRGWPSTLWLRPFGTLGAIGLSWRGCHLGKVREDASCSSLSVVSPAP